MIDNLNPNRKYYIDKKGQVRRAREPHLLALYNQKVSYAMGYCKLKECYLTPDNVSEKSCLMKGNGVNHCRHFIHMSGQECWNGLKHKKQRKWEGK